MVSEVENVFHLCLTTIFKYFLFQYVNRVKNIYLNIKGSIFVWLECSVSGVGFINQRDFKTFCSVALQASLR